MENIITALLVIGVWVFIAWRMWRWVRPVNSSTEPNTMSNPWLKNKKYVYTYTHKLKDGGDPFEIFDKFFKKDNGHKS